MFISCNIQDLLDAEQITLDTYTEIESILKTYIDKASKLDNYGNTDQANLVWEYGDKIVYLVGYLFIIRQRILKDYRNCELKTLTEYKDIYKLDCIKKKFSCFKIPFDVDDLYEIFGVGSSLGFEGIAYMALEEDEDPVCNETSIFEFQ
jgi:hypothetical protein